MNLIKTQGIIGLTVSAIILALGWVTFFDESFNTYHRATLNENKEIIVISEEQFFPIKFLLSVLCLVALVFVIIGQTILVKRCFHKGSEK